jgi:transcriptional regulator with XRE-family HTH domain
VPTLPNLRRLRERALLTQDELANRAGVARSTLVKLERLEAEARPSTIRKLAAALNCDPMSLLPPPQD